MVRQLDFFTTKKIEASINEPACDIIQRAGVITVMEGKCVFWLYDGKKVGRPPVNKWEEMISEHFGIEIKYID